MLGMFFFDLTPIFGLLCDLANVLRLCRCHFFVQYRMIYRIYLQFYLQNILSANSSDEEKEIATAECFVIGVSGATRLSLLKGIKKFSKTPNYGIFCAALNTLGAPEIVGWPLDCAVLSSTALELARYPKREGTATTPKIEQNYLFNSY